MRFSQSWSSELPDGNSLKPLPASGAFAPTRRLGPARAIVPLNLCCSSCLTARAIFTARAGKKEQAQKGYCDSKSQICRAYPAPTESVMGDMPDEVSPFRLKVGIIGAKVLIFWRNNCKFAVVTPHQSPSVTASPGRCRSPLWLQTCHRHVCLTRRASQGKPFGMSKIEMR